MRTVHLIIRGVVQGVGFRAFVVEQARKLGLTGWVRNNSDGTVEVTVVGSKNRLDKLTELCRKGPAAARVDDITIKQIQNPEPVKTFRVIY